MTPRLYLETKESVMHFFRRAIFSAVLLASAVLSRAGVSYEESSAFAFDTRDDLSGLAVESGTFAFDTRALDGLSGSAVSGAFFFDTRTQSLNGLAITGTGQVAPGQSAQFYASAAYSDSQQFDVTASAQWSIVGTPPPGTVIAGGLLQVGASATGGPLTIAASYQTTSGKRTGQKTVTVSNGFAVSATHTLQSLGGNSYVVSLSATPSGGTPPYSFAWDTNGNGVYDDLSGQNPQWSLTSTGGSYRAKVRATDNQGRTGYATRTVSIDKTPVVNQPEKLKPAIDVGGGLMMDSAGNPITYDTAKRDVGLIVLTHGLHSTEESDKQWLKDMAADIEQELPEQGKAVPNVAIYDWGADTNPADADPSAFVTLALRLLSRFQGSGLLSLAAKYGPQVADFVIDAKYIRPIGRSHGQILANYLWLEARANPPRIDKLKPVHLVGHSAGGFVMGECARVLKQLGFTVDLVTMLDTPFPYAEHLRPDPTNGYPNPGTTERLISSAFGTFDWSDAKKIDPDGFYYTYALLDGYQYPTTAAHSHAHEWYLNNTILGREQSGFYNSPFLHGRQVNHGAQAAMAEQGPLATGMVMDVSGEAASATSGTTEITDFSTFGQVSESGGVYTITEQADAGIYKEITIPPGVEKLRFKYKFSGTGDGDFLGVRVGTRPEVYLGLDLAISRDDYLEAEVELGEYAGMTDKLVFTLVSRGNPGAVLEIKDIEITESDDPDGDGLTVAQELAAGSSSQSADTDGDGLGDYVEVNTHGTNPALADSDSDGMSDAMELKAGTNPNNNTSVFAVKDISRSGNGILLRWSGVAGKTYKVLRSATPGFENFDVIANGLPGAEPTTSYTDSTVPAGASAMFYKVVVEGE